MNKKNLDKFISEALAIEAQETAEAGALGYMTRALTQATMPHKHTPGNEFTRTNGFFSLSMLAPSSVGLPYGSIPRLLVSWITTEAVRIWRSSAWCRPAAGGVRLPACGTR